MGCGKMKAGGSVKKIKKMAEGGSATNKLNNPRPATKPQRGGSNVKMGIYGVPNAGPTGPNIQGVNTMKKGGAVSAVKRGCPPGTQRLANGRCGQRSLYGA